MSGLSNKEPCVGCGQPLCPNPAEFCERAALVWEVTNLRNMHTKLLADMNLLPQKEKIQEFIPDRGILLNKLARLSSEIVRFRDQIPELEKQARKTPARTMLAEKAKVLSALQMLEVVRSQLEEKLNDQAQLRKVLTEMKAWG